MKDLIKKTGIFAGLLMILVLGSLVYVYAQVHTLEIYPEGGDELISQEINLNSGWNLISLGVVPENGSVEAVFGSVMDKVIVVKGFDNGGKTYDPLLPQFSTLKILKPKYGYWVKMNESAVLDYNC